MRTLHGEDDDEKTVKVKDCFIQAATAQAILVQADGREVWIPQSQVHADSEIWKKGERGTLIISKWIAESKGLVK